MEADLDGEVENEMKKLLTIFIAYILIVLLALLPKISSTFQLFLLFYILERYWYIGPFLKYMAPKNGL